MSKIKTRGLVLGLLNAQSLNTGREELIVTMERYKLDILAVNETWVRSGEEQFTSKIPGYSFKHRPRPNGRRGGGVGFYVRNGLSVRIKPHPESSLEQMWLELSLPGIAKIAIGTAYRPEAITVQTAIDALSESTDVFSHCQHCFILGDLNVDMFKINETRAKALAEFMQQRGLSLLGKEPTRITAKSSTLLDLI